MGKKKPFIDKKNSSKYHLLYRSQRDVAGDDDTNDNGNDDGGSGVVLWPSPNNNSSTDQQVLLGKKESDQTAASTLGQWKQQLTGLVDEYDYEKHMKPISGTGKMLKPTGKDHQPKAMSALLNARDMDVRDEIVKEVDRQFDSIALSAECMDPEIAEALFGDFDADDYEELNDEYFLDAAEEPEVEEEVPAGFDFAAHVKMLMERAKLESQEVQELAADHEVAQKDAAFFRKAKPLQSVYEELEDESLFGGVEWHGDGHADLGVAPKLSEAAEKALIDKFNETLAEYDSDDMGEGYDDEGAMGSRPLEGDAHLEAALDDYLTEKKDEIFMQGTRQYEYMETGDGDPMDGSRRHGGSGFSALVGTRMIPVKQLDKDDSHVAKVMDAPPIAEVLTEARMVLSDPLAAPPDEDVLIDGKSYYSERMRNPWDCESILSTYSNMDNNPMTIKGGGRRGRQRRKQKGSSSSSVVSEQEYDPDVHAILLSDKTGLPLGVLPEHDGGDDHLATDTLMSVNKGEARKKKETAEEKKERKQNIKVERQMARMQKKMMKEAFSAEFSKRATDVVADDIGGTTVFRF